MQREHRSPPRIVIDSDSFNRLIVAGIPARAALRLVHLKSRLRDEQDCADARWLFARWLARTGKLAG